MAKGFPAGPYEVMFYVAMREGPAYGYELAARYRKMCGGHMRVSYGTIYPFLRRMERRGIIRSRRDGESGRVYYELTRQGKAAQLRISKRIKESQKQFEEKLLGILAMHANVFGQKAHRELLRRVQ